MEFTAAYLSFHSVEKKKKKKKEACSHNEYIFQGTSFGGRRLGAKIFVPSFKPHP